MKIVSKILTVAGVLGAIVTFVSSNALAVKTGLLCSSCHTMHDSQGAANVGSAGAQEGLLTQSCLGCHTGTNTALTSVLNGATDAPYVLGDVLPTMWTNTLAGGNFWWTDIDAANDAYGHNVDLLGTNGVDDTLTGDPPGWSEHANFHVNVDRSGNAWDGTNLTCDGVYGCHGNATDGVIGDHHTHTHSTTTGQTSTYFRFLQGIEGWEDEDWEFDVGANDQNMYKGEIRASTAKNLTTTMTYFCAGCHGNFHADDDSAGTGTLGVTSSATISTASLWIRHPVDIALNDYGAVYQVYTTYDKHVPVAFADISNDTITGDIQTEEGIITCVTCHFAHGGPNKDLLRWDYSGDSAYTDNYSNGDGWETGDSTDTGLGCFKCHTDKD